MFKTNRNFLPACFCILFLLFCGIVNAQPKRVKSALADADELYERKKYNEALVIYQQQQAYLSALQQYQLGISYITGGKENPAYYTEGLKWLQKSAESDNTEAMNAISFCYSKGLGVPKDSVLEVSWVKRSAERGDASAMNVMGYRYDKGMGVIADKKLSDEMYKKAAEKGSKEAAYNLGLKRFNEKNGQEALYFLTKAANADLLPAMLKLAELYEVGMGTKKDPDEAVRWYTKITETKGYTNAHSKAYDRIYSIGAVEPSVSITTVKPLMLKLISGAGSQFAGLMNREVEPLHQPRNAFFSTFNWYSCLVDPGFKNATIKKEIVEDRTVGELKTRAGTYYSYSADIVHSVSEEDANRIFDQWVKVLKEVVPSWTGSNTTDNDGRSFYIGGKLTNGKTINISLSVCCPANNLKQVYIRIDSE